MPPEVLSKVPPVMVRALDPSPPMFPTLSVPDERFVPPAIVLAPLSVKVPPEIFTAPTVLGPVTRIVPLETVNDPPMLVAAATRVPLPARVSERLAPPSPMACPPSEALLALAGQCQAITQRHRIAGT